MGKRNKKSTPTPTHGMIDNLQRQSRQRRPSPWALDKQDLMLVGVVLFVALYNFIYPYLFPVEETGS
jgi:hypothetical protein